MAWKNLKHLSLANSLTSAHEALTELDDINELMDWEDIEYLLGDIHAKRRDLYLYSRHSVHSRASVRGSESYIMAWVKPFIWD
jgi:hypothetical protein